VGTDFNRNGDLPSCPSAIGRPCDRIAHAVLRKDTETGVSNRFDAALIELQEELQKATPLKETVNLLFPETRSWVHQVSTTTDYLQAGMGPKEAVVPELPRRSDTPMQAAVELWVRLPADDPRLDRVSRLWNGAQRALNGMRQDGTAAKTNGIDTVEAVRVGSWWVFDLHTASTRARADVAQEARADDQRLQ
jgi:hypothetical protein